MEATVGVSQYCSLFALASFLFFRELSCLHIVLVSVKVVKVVAKTLMFEQLSF